jgi:hypothetical protein
MDEIRIPQQISVLLKTLSVNKRIEVLSELFDNGELFQETEINTYSSMLQMVEKDQLSGNVNRFLEMLYKLNIINKDELENIITNNITLRPDNVKESDYLSTLKIQLDNFYETAYAIFTAKLLNEKNKSRILDKAEKYINAADLARLFSLGVANISNLRRSEKYFQNSVKGTKLEIPYSDVDHYVNLNRKYKTVWNSYKNGQ